MLLVIGSGMRKYHRSFLSSSLWIPFSVLIIICLATFAAARPPSLRVDQPAVLDPEELVVAINPADPNMLIAGANIDHVFVSNDGGMNWTSSTLASSLGVVGDPCVVFDADGIAYYAHLSFPAGFESWLDRIVVQRSLDGGITWSDGYGIGLDPPTDQDKEWLAVDRTHLAYHGQIYMAWTRFDLYGSSATTDSTRILFSRSLDQGLSWQPPMRINEEAGNCWDNDQTVEGSVPAVGPEGQVYVAWSFDDDIWFDRSFDGGETFGTDIHVSDQPDGWVFDVPGLMRCNGLPITACDVSESPYRGRVYVLFSDQRNGTDDTDVFLCRSDDQGTTWSAPIRVNDDTGHTHQFFPWLAVDPTTGHLHVVFYDRRVGPGAMTEVFLAQSTDGGDTFVNTRISETAFTPQDDVFMGDYIGIDAYNGVAHAIWTRMDAGDLSVWTARADYVTGVRTDGSPAVSRVQLVISGSNPSGHHARIAFTLYQATEALVTIHDVRGRLVRTLVTGPRGVGEHTVFWDGRDQRGASVPSGVYLCHLKAGRDVVNRKVTIVR